MSSEDPLWEESPLRPLCTKHVWVYYHSHGFRECPECNTRQKLIHDFGIGPKRDEEE